MTDCEVDRERPEDRFVEATVESEDTADVREDVPVDEFVDTCSREKALA
jgi:hypothetical protein